MSCRILPVFLKKPAEKGIFFLKKKAAENDEMNESKLIPSMIVPALYAKAAEEGSEYADKILAMEAANLIAYWPLWEAAGVNADNYEGTAARDGTYVGATLGQTGIGDGHTAPLFDGVNDTCEIFTDSLSAAFNGEEGSISMWMRVANVGVWTDGIQRALTRLFCNAGNYAYLAKWSLNNEVRFEYKSGGVSKYIKILGIETTDWFHIGYTWTKNGDLVKGYYNGSPIEEGQSGLGAWACGGLDGTRTRLAADFIDTNLFSGYLAHVAIWTKALSDADMASLGTV